VAVGFKDAYRGKGKELILMQRASLQVRGEQLEPSWNPVGTQSQAWSNSGPRTGSRCRAGSRLTGSRREITVDSIKKVDHAELKPQG
jgi:hypothetical protein